jgi:BirA family biotin operon repressor/biotin-[acetyl-CoA-carboxylase] ligase
MAISWTIELHDSIPSTQDIARGLAHLGRMEGTVVQALQQSSGRGRHGREWVSKPGNLFISLILNPACPAAQIGQLSTLISLAVTRAVQECVPASVKTHIKWPNDVMIDGEKCAGILLETELTGSNVKWVIVGLGLNIVGAPPGLGTYIQKYNPKAERDAVRDACLSHISDLYQRWMRIGFDGIRVDWLALSHQKDDPVRIRIGAQIEEGRFYGIDEVGNLQIQDREHRLKLVTAGEIYGVGQ